MKATPQQESRIVALTIASDLRIALDGWPEHTIEAFADEADGDVVGIMLEAHLEDVGGPESGPKLSMEPMRFLQVVRRGNYWYLDLYDYTSMPRDNDEYDPSWERPSMTLHLPNLDGERIASNVAHEIVKTVKALGLRYMTN